MLISGLYTFWLSAYRIFLQLDLETYEMGLSLASAVGERTAQAENFTEFMNNGSNYKEKNYRGSILVWFLVMSLFVYLQW